MGSTSMARRAAGPVAAGITLVLVLAGCGPRNSPVGSYEITGIYTQDQRLQPLLPGTRITLQFTGDGKLSGQACNSYGGSWANAARGFRVSGLYSTDMACGEPEGVMAQEYEYLGRLDEVGSVLRQGNTVTFGSPGEPSYRIFEARRL
jgi:hypothetical protein